MTYRELLEKLNTLTPAQLEKDVLYQDTNNGEFYGLRAVRPGEDYGGAEVGLSEEQVLLDIVQ
jgi:hypothetical protein